MDRRLKALDTLRRIEERALEQISRELNVAQAAQGAAQTRIADLQHRAAHEASSTQIEALPYIGRFLAGLRAEQTREAQIAAALDGRIAQLRDAVLERFTSEKTYDHLASHLRQEKAQDQVRHAEAQIEDLSSARYLRNRTQS